MPVSVEWDDNLPDVMVMTFVSPWTWEEYYITDDKFSDMLAEPAPKRVDVIVNFTAGTVVPAGVFSHFQRSSQTTHPSIHMIIIVGVNDLLRSVLSVICRLFPHIKRRLKFASSIDDARASISASRSEA